MDDIALEEFPVPKVTKVQIDEEDLDGDSCEVGVTGPEEFQVQKFELEVTDLDSDESDSVLMSRSWSGRSC